MHAAGCIRRGHLVIYRRVIKRASLSLGHDDGYVKINPIRCTLTVTEKHHVERRMSFFS